MIFVREARWIPDKLSTINRGIEQRLNENARKERRILLVLSAIALFMICSGLLPTGISAMGLSLPVPTERIFFGLFVGAILFFLAAFWIYASNDYRIRRSNGGRSRRDDFMFE
jgi:hypothetical protein